VHQATARSVRVAGWLAGKSVIRTLLKDKWEEFAMTTLISNLAFSGMSLIFKVRDFITPRRQILEEAGLRPGDRVLDYGCGPGAYIPGAAEMVGESGEVYALDVHPLAIRRVQSIAKRQGLTNVETIHSDCRTDLPNESLDAVLLYDVFHMLDKPRAVLAELYRVLKSEGTVSFSDHHMRHENIIVGMTDGRTGRAKAGN
jgi:ubiquinone/menaquinone biosynthesis C-methylase UbiE